MLPRRLYPLVANATSCVESNDDNYTNGVVLDNAMIRIRTEAKSVFAVSLSNLKGGGSSRALGH
jgi:hypothetical protein